MSSAGGDEPVRKSNRNMRSRVGTVSRRRPKPGRTRATMLLRIRLMSILADRSSTSGEAVELSMSRRASFSHRSVAARERCHRTDASD